MQIEQLNEIIQAAQNAHLTDQDEAENQIEADLSQMLELVKAKVHTETGVVVFDLDRAKEAIRIYGDMLINYSSINAMGVVGAELSKLIKLYKKSTPEDFHRKFPEAMDAVMKNINAASVVCADNVEICEQDLEHVMKLK